MCGSARGEKERGTRCRLRRCGISKYSAADKCSLLRCWWGRISGMRGVCCWRRKSWTRCMVHNYRSSLRTMDDDNIGSLWRMVQDLKEMDAAWRVSVDGPSLAEQSLYVLILGHVCSEIFLFHHEKYSRLHYTPEDEVEWLVKELKDKGSDFGATLTNGNLNIDVNLNIEGKEEDESFHNFLDTNSWDHVSFLISNLVGLRRSLCEVAPPVEVDIDGGKADATNVVETREKPLREILPGLSAKRSERSCAPQWEILPGLSAKRSERSCAPQLGKEVECYRENRKRVTSNICFIKAKVELLGKWRCFETREKTLRDILHGLAARRSEYAPPVGKELECYRAIRKWVTSNICFIKAKSRLVGRLRSFEDGNYFAFERNQLSERNHLWSNWECILDMNPTSEITFYAPMGYKFALIFDEFSDFRSLLSIWKRRFSDITIARYSQEESMDVSLGTDSPDIKVDELRPVGLEVEKKLKHDLYVIDVCKSAKKTRYEYLLDIFSAFVSMGHPSHSLDIVEFRMYTRILEHLNSYMWLAYKEANPGEVGLFYRLRKDEEGTVSETDTWTREKKTREQYLKEIVSIVDVIESEYFLLPPSLKEWLLYDKIERRATMDSCWYMKGGEETGSAEEAALARRVLKFTFAREAELASGLEKEIVDTLGSIFARSMPTETKFTEWLVEHMKDAESDMKVLATKDSRGFKLFDRALLSMLEIKELYKKLHEKFLHANCMVYHALHKRKLFQVPLREGLTTLPWLEEDSK